TITGITSTSVTTNAQGLGTATFTLPNQSGSYRMRASVDFDGRSISDDTYAWVPGSDIQVDSDQQFVELMADRRSYAPGDTAKLMARGAAVSGPVLVTKEGQHVSWYRVLRPGAGDAIDVPIDAADTGDVVVNIAYLRDGRLYRAERRLSVPAVDQTLQITL